MQGLAGSGLTRFVCSADATSLCAGSRRVGSDCVSARRHRGELWLQLINLIICDHGEMILPVYSSAFEEICGNLRKFRRRYVGALVLKEDERVLKVSAIDPDPLSDVGRIAGFLFDQRLSFTFAGMDFSTFRFFIEKLIRAATSASSYSVWAQFYDNQSELESSLSSFRSISDVCRALHIYGDHEVSHVLV